MSPQLNQVQRKIVKQGGEMGNILQEGPGSREDLAESETVLARKPTSPEDRNNKFKGPEVGESLA